MKAKFFIVTLILLILVLTGYVSAGCPGSYISGSSGCCDDQFECQPYQAIYRTYTGCRSSKRDCKDCYVPAPITGCEYSDTACIFFDAYTDSG